MGFQWHGGKEPACQWADSREAGVTPGSGRSPGGGNGNPLQHSCQENSMDRGAWGYCSWGLKESETQCLSTYTASLMTPLSLHISFPWISLFGDRNPVVCNGSWKNALRTGCRDWLNSSHLSPSHSHSALNGRLRPGVQLPWELGNPFTQACWAHHFLKVVVFFVSVMSILKFLSSVSLPFLPTEVASFVHSILYFSVFENFFN